MADVLIGLGGNLGDVRETLDRAVAELCADGATRLVAQSSDYRTPPWGITDQPFFVNRCIAVETALAPQTLLSRAHAIERALGRDRKREPRYGPRRVDIDLLAYDDLTLDAPGLRLPHPHWSERAFVVVPLADIAAGRRIGGITVAEALTALDRRGIDRLPARPDTAG